MDKQNIFAGAYIDRSGHRREDHDWLRSNAVADDAAYVVVCDDRCSTIDEPPRIRLHARKNIADHDAANDGIFLGIFRGAPTFAMAIKDESVVSETQDAGKSRGFHDLRYLGSVLNADEANLAAHAVALINWHAQQSFCGRCGSASAIESGGNSRLCTNTECATRIFPRIDPAIIVLVADGDYCLLGRQPSWPDGRYSTVAGFVEPGESLEDAVCREVFEETNIRVGAIHYDSSQPWPFPSSLMLGFTAEATSQDIVLNDGELEDARWFSRKELTSGFPKLPYRVSISRRLIDNWIQNA